MLLYGRICRSNSSTFSRNLRSFGDRASAGAPPPGPVWAAPCGKRPDSADHGAGCPTPPARRCRCGVALGPPAPDPGGIQHTVPLLPLVQQTGQLHPWFPKIGGLRRGPEIPLQRLVLTAQRKAGPGQKPHGCRPLIPPHRLRHGQVALQDADTILPPSPKQVLPAQIVHIPGSSSGSSSTDSSSRFRYCPRVFPDPGDGQLDPFRRRRRPRSALPHPLEHLMHRMDPPVAPAGVDLIAPEHHTL